MGTNKRSLPARLSAALLALIMVMALTPAAQAISSHCPQCGAACEMNVIREANCHEEAILEYLCTNTAGNCPMANRSNLVKGNSIDSSNHDAVYTDAGNGCHTGVCGYHASPVSLPAEPHDFSNGVCTKCGVMDYGSVKMNLPDDLVIPVAVGSTDAKLSVGELKLTLGNNNVTDEYTISYHWYYDGAPVATTEEYTLPASITDVKGSYEYVLHIIAAPKSSLRQTVTGSCVVTVHVKDLITASATLSTKDASLYLGDQDAWSGESVYDQIYIAVQDCCPSGEYPDYVTFQTPPASTVGSLVINTATRYYFEDYSNLNRKLLDDVLFNVSTASNATTGDYRIDFIVYDTGGNPYDGVLTITVQQHAGDMDVVLTTAKNGFLTLSAEDFEDFWNKSHPNGVLDSITFKRIPRSTSAEGALYVDYISASSPGLLVRASDTFYVTPGRGQYGIDAVTFVPGAKQTEYITLDFEAQGIKSNGRGGYLKGTVYIFIHGSGSADVAVAAAAGGTALNPTDFQKAYQSATGGTGVNFSIQLLEVPAKGTLYIGRTANHSGTPLNSRNVGNYLFYYGTSRGETISTLTYVPDGGAVSESIRYVACSAQGKPLYVGRITFTSSGTTTPTTPTTPTATGLVLDLPCSAAGVKLSAGSFENLPGAAAPKLTTVSFTPPAAAYGSLYYNRTATEEGTRITSTNFYFSTVTVNPPIGSLSLDNLTFVPAAGTAGTTIPIAFTATDAANNRYAGTLRIVVAGTATVPGTTTPGTTTPGTVTVPAKSFSDVPKTAGSYPYITALTTSGALKGYPDGTFKPGNTVTVGEALKLIMCVANPAEYNDEKLPPVDGGHWASGYLERAIQDGLLPANVNRNMDRVANRYTIAEVAAKAMKLTPVENAAATPFADMPLTNSSAKYVLALYDIRVITGTVNSQTGQLVYYGVNAITREDFATIVWRIQSYLQNGYVGTIGVG